MYDRVNGGAYFPGTTQQVVEKQILSGMIFQPRAYKQDLAFNMFQLDVLNSGPAGYVSIYDAYYENATSAMATDLNIDAYQHGQAASSTVLQSRIQFMNGIDEALNDGINPGYLGNVYSNYGGQIRNGVVTNTINAIPIWAGNADGSPGALTYATLLAGYQNCISPPDTGLCNKAAWTFLATRQEPKQIFQQEMDVRVGLTGFKIMDAYVHVDKLAPSTKFGQINPPGLSQTTPGPLSKFTSPTFSTGQNAISNFPSNTLCSPGEPFFWLRMKDWELRPSDSPEYSWTFTPLIRAQEAPDNVVAYFKVAINWYTPSPRDNCQIVGFGF